MGFIGTFESTVDNKNRFLFPAALKKQFADGGNKFVVSCGLDGCLMIYPLESWEKVEENLKNLKDSDPNVRQFKTVFLGGSFVVELDAAGRASLQPVLIKHGGIKKDIVLASYIDKIKIWDAEKYKQFFEKTPSQDFTALALQAGVEI